MRVWFNFASAAFDAPVQVCALAAYKVQRRARPSGDWADAATGRESAITVTGQTRAREFKDGVVGMNKTGEGEGKRRRHGGAGRMILL